MLHTYYVDKILEINFWICDFRWYIHSIPFIICIYKCEECVKGAGEVRDMDERNNDLKWTFAILCHNDSSKAKKKKRREENTQACAHTFICARIKISNEWTKKILKCVFRTLIFYEYLAFSVMIYSFCKS